VEPLQGIQVTKITAGGDSSACVLATGEVYTWGCNKYGQLGISMIHHDEHASDLGSAYLHPQMVLGLIGQEVKTVCVGSQHMVAVCAHRVEALPLSVRSEHSEPELEELEEEETEMEAPALDLSVIRKKTSVYVADSHSRRETPQNTFRDNAVGV
jgi:alpha-tubulin suppressor-like RCC1 family protein